MYVTGASAGATTTVTVLGRDKSTIAELLKAGRKLKRDNLQKFLHVITPGKIYVIRILQFAPASWVYS